MTQKCKTTDQLVIQLFPGRQPPPETVGPHDPLLEDYYEDTIPEMPI